MVKMLTILVITISSSQLFWLKKKISIYSILNDQSFNDTLTNNIVSFEQLGPVFTCHLSTMLVSFVSDSDELHPSY